jgi:hypothetical protein
VGCHPGGTANRDAPRNASLKKTDCPKEQDQEKETRKAATGSTFIPLVTHSVCVMKMAMTACTLKDE